MTTPIFKNTYKVYINHTDAGGIVYHANHLTFFENCRRDWLTSIGFDGYFFEQDGTAGTDGQGGKVHFVVSGADLSYKIPLLVDDKLVVSIQEVIRKPASLIITQHIYRNDDDFKNNKIASVGIITLACVMNVAGMIRPCRLPVAFAKTHF